MANQRLTYLFEQYFDDSATLAEQRELAAIVLSREQELDLQELLQTAWDNINADKDVAENKSVIMLENILRDSATVTTKIHTMTWRKWAVAASVAIVLGVSSYFVFFNHGSKQSTIAETTIKTDVAAPMKNRAMITLADGRQIFLDSADNGALAMQASVQVTKLADGQIEYSSQAASPLESAGGELLNTLSNPRGSKVINMTLADGTKVWLDAGSSITYPVAFRGKERKVNISGQAYFEVKHNEAMPFTVSANGIDVHDIGTAFNINAYTDEGPVKVTLVEGSIKVNNDKTEHLIIPGQQAVVDNNNYSLNEQVNMEQVMAWKNGYFVLKGADMQTLMRQVARWYNVTVVYEGAVPDKKFGGSINRNVSLAVLCEALKQNGIQTLIENDTLKVR